MSNTNKQYRVIFEELETTGPQTYSTKWFNSLEEATATQWAQKSGACIISRELQTESMPAFNL